MAYHNHKPFKCSYCIKDFKKERQLLNHMRDAHPVELKKEQDKIVDKIIDELIVDSDVRAGRLK